LKLALRYYKQNEDMLRADLYADSLAVKDYNIIWSHRKTNIDKSTKFANHVGGCSGTTEIAGMCRQHLNELFKYITSGDEMKT